jgi:hypothetical protein
MPSRDKSFIIMGDFKELNGTMYSKVKRRMKERE